MKLMMYLGSDLVESINVDTEKISLPGYLGGHTRKLKAKHEVLVAFSSKEPEFLISREQYFN